MRGLKLLSLEEFVKDSKKMYDEHLSSYCQITVKRAMGKFYEFFDGIQDLLKTKTAEDIAFQPSYNKVQAKKTLALYPAKEIKKTVEQLYKKVEKHFSDNESLSKVVWRHMQDELMAKHAQYSDIVQRCYTDPEVVLQFTTQDILNSFSEMK